MSHEHQQPPSSQNERQPDPTCLSVSGTPPVSATGIEPESKSPDPDASLPKMQRAEKHDEPHLENAICKVQTSTGKLYESKTKEGFFLLKESSNSIRKKQMNGYAFRDKTVVKHKGRVTIKVRAGEWLLLRTGRG